MAKNKSRRQDVNPVSDPKSEELRQRILDSQYQMQLEEEGQRLKQIQEQAESSKLRNFLLLLGILPVFILLGVLNNRKQIGRIRVHILIFLDNSHRLGTNHNGQFSSCLVPMINNHVSLQITFTQECQIDKGHSPQQKQQDKHIPSKRKPFRQRLLICHQPTDHLRGNSPFHLTINPGVYPTEKTGYIRGNPSFNRLIINGSQRPHIG